MSSNTPSTPLSALAEKMARGLNVPSLAPAAEAPAARPVAAPKAADPAPAERRAPEPKPVDAAPAFAEEQGGRLSATQSFRIDPGKAKVTVTSRVPKDLHGQLKIAVLAMQLSSGETDDRATMNEFIIEAIREKLKRTKVA